MGKIITFIIRWLLTITIVFMVYREMGVWTAVSLFLLFAGTEVNVFFLKIISKRLKGRCVNDTN